MNALGVGYVIVATHQDNWVSESMSIPQFVPLSAAA